MQNKKSPAPIHWGKAMLAVPPGFSDNSHSHCCFNGAVRRAFGLRVRHTLRGGSHCASFRHARLQLLRTLSAAIQNTASPSSFSSYSVYRYLLS